MWENFNGPFDTFASTLEGGMYFDAVTVAGAPELDGFWKAPAGLGRLLAACSATGPAAYVEADYFGGTGTQAAQVWHAGKVVLGPLHKGERESPAVGGSPISQALRRLGAANTPAALVMR